MGRVIVVGGGAAGMMAAHAAAERGHSVTLLEQNEKLGKKLFITGKGRCNVTNGCEPDAFFENVVSNPKFLFSAFYGFDNGQTARLLEEAGCPLKTERGGRVFPVSDHAYDVTDALVRLLQKGGVRVRLRTKVRDLWTEPAAAAHEAESKMPAVCVEESLTPADHAKEKQTPAAGDGRARYRETIRGVLLADGGTMEADAVILATGGLSYPSTGSDGAGHRIAAGHGHTVTACSPALVPMETAELWCRTLQGLSLKNVTLALCCGSRTVWQGFGEMLFTHFGISGPLVLSASSYYGKCKDKNGVTAVIDLKPALSAEQLDRRILRDFDESPNKAFKNVIGKLYPAGLVPIMTQLSEIDGEKKVNEVTRGERERLADVTKHLTLHVTGLRGYAEAVVTQGGVRVKEVNPSTMESKLVRGLYFAGELLDVDALTGGFNLQIAWSTGHLAGASVPLS